MTSNDIILPDSSMRFGVGSVISISFKVLFANIGRLLAIGVLVSLPVMALATVAVMLIGLRSLELEAAAVRSSLSSSHILVLCLLAVAFLVSYPVAIGAISYSTFRYLAGAPVRIGESLRVAWRALPQMLGAVLVMILIYLGIGLAVLLLGIVIPFVGAIIGGVLAIVAGILLNIRWWPAFAAIVVERSGVIASLSRSAMLTEGRRGSVFGVMIVIFLISVGIALVNGILGLIPGIGLISSFVSLLLGIFIVVAPAVGYYLLRVEKEGIGIDEIVRVFD